MIGLGSEGCPTNRVLFFVLDGKSEITNTSVVIMIISLIFSSSDSVHVHMKLAFYTLFDTFSTSNMDSS